MNYNNQTLVAGLLGIAILGGIYLHDQNIILTVTGALAGILTTKGTVEDDTIIEEIPDTA